MRLRGLDGLDAHRDGAGDFQHDHVADLDLIEARHAGVDRDGARLAAGAGEGDGAVVAINGSDGIGDLDGGEIGGAGRRRLDPILLGDGRRVHIHAGGLFRFEAISRLGLGNFAERHGHLVGVADGDLLLELNHLDVVGADLDYDPTVVRADDRDQLVGYIDGLHRGDHGDDAGVAFDLNRTGFRIVNEHKRYGDGKNAFHRGDEYPHELSSKTDIQQTGDYQLRVTPITGPCCTKSRPFFPNRPF